MFFWPFRGWPSQSSVGPAELGEPNPRTQRPRSAAHTLAVAVVDQAGPPPRRDPRHPRTWGRATSTRAPARGLRPASRAPLPSLISLPPELGASPSPPPVPMAVAGGPCLLAAALAAAWISAAAASSSPEQVRGDGRVLLVQADLHTRNLRPTSRWFGFGGCGSRTRVHV